jgi:hypothetical protein
MNRNMMVDPEEQARRRAISDVLSPAPPPAPKAEASPGPLEAPEPMAGMDLNGRSGSLSDKMGGNTGMNPGAIPELQGDDSYKTPSKSPLMEAPSAPPPSAPDQSAWNTDGYAKPASVAQDFAGKAPAGWDQGKWNNPNHQTPKYVWGRITQDNNPDDIAQMLAAYPGSSFNGKDKISGIQGLGPIDVYQGASTGNPTPQWHDINAAAAEGGVAPQAPSMGGAPSLGGMPVGAGPINSTYQRLLKQLQEITGTAQGDQDALSQLLGGK